MSRNGGNKTFLSPYPGAFEQLFCPGGGAFASLFLNKMPIIGITRDNNNNNNNDFI